MRKSTLFSCLALSFGFFATGANAQQYATLLFDNTASMQQLRTDAKTRCQYGKELLLASVAAVFGRADYLNVKVFGAPDELFSISNGFYNITGLAAGFGPGKVFFDNIQQQVNALSCDAWSSALGDAICASIDELRLSVPPTTTQQPRIALVTDGGENSSLRCGGTNYVSTHIIPRLSNPAPKVSMSISVLTAGGNVGAQVQDSSATFERINSTAVGAVAVGAGAADQLTTAVTTSRTSEVQALINAAQVSGGGAVVIEDNDDCIYKCDPLSQDPSGDDWGGAW